MVAEGEKTFRPCVLVPVYDNAATVAAVVLGSRALGLTVLVVDDGSRDGSGELAAGAGGVVVRHDANRGKGAALMTGFREALARGFTHALSIDADGQHFPEDIPSVLELGATVPDALVVGARDFTNQPHLQGKSMFGRSFSNFWVWFETGVRVQDTQCGLRLYPLALVTRLGLTRERFDFEVEVIVRSAWAGLPVLSTPVKVHYPPPAERISHFDVWRDNVRISLLNVRLVARRLVPWPHAKLVKRDAKTLRQRFHDLTHESSGPVALGVAVAVGCLIATTPFFGLQTGIAIVVAALLRLNKVATLLGSFITTPPLTVPIFLASIWVGQFLLHGQATCPDHFDLEVAKACFRECLVGGVVVGAGIGLLLGGLTTLFVGRARRRRALLTP